MMKKLALSGLLAATLVSGAEYNYEISPMAGIAIPNDGQWMKNHGVYGAEMQFNECGTSLKPELSLLYSNADYVNAAGSTNIFRSALNGVYELPKSNGITPFLKMGFGYEMMSNHQFDNHNGAFADAGAGVKIGLAEQLALKLEAIKMLKNNNFSGDNNLLLMAGLSFAFGEKPQPVIPVAAAVVAAPVVVPVPEPVPEPVVVPAPVVVKAAPVVAAPIDSDKDGVFDPQDKCPNTPAGFKVDTDGCPVITATLELKFAVNSNAVDAEGTEKVKVFATFMKDIPEYKAAIVGHTDSDGSNEFNQKLSEKRANHVKSMLVKEGVAENRLTTSGKGESIPVATNATKEGRAQNRRIEVELSR
ncbi:MAG: OmpA family protein [Sulfuricurvum sp.]|jgi:OOP family OmpA-OmpF porin|uniref:OmpA family protein n=1 Tax=Sulfuricurvum sp. TaxID=2025608 RepID=UPI0025F352D1|nr:OmpA family protein [Sulfuricurvum sp.]MCK9371599.1 OmpA family protein [Sulfuricurvum sp.]